MNLLFNKIFKFIFVYINSSIYSRECAIYKYFTGTLFCEIIKNPQKFTPVKISTPTFRCAEAAFKKGYKVIGTQFYGECWSGPQAHVTFDKYGPTDMCVNSELSRNISDTKHCQAAVGLHSTNYVYRIAPTGNLLHGFLARSYIFMPLY